MEQENREETKQGVADFLKEKGAMVMEKLAENKRPLIAALVLSTALAFGAPAQAQEAPEQLCDNTLIELLQSHTQTCRGACIDPILADLQAQMDEQAAIRNRHDGNRRNQHLANEAFVRMTDLRQQINRIEDHKQIRCVSNFIRTNPVFSGVNVSISSRNWGPMQFEITR